MKYIEADDKDIAFVERDSYPFLTEVQKREAAGHWAIAAVENPFLFNKGVYCCNGLLEIGNLVLASINTADYATYKWARDKNLSLPGVYAAGTGTYLFDPDRKLYLGFIWTMTLLN